MGTQDPGGGSLRDRATLRQLRDTLRFVDHTANDTGSARVLGQHRSVDCRNAKANFHFERTVRYRKSNDEDQELLDFGH